ncbi:beta-lactamase family protein [Gramella sp. GC03-9]|uniref:Beta-lactamase family protein n=1 Tax=Christiangramia oceanisediminis TaxID=2920386 RepID=A0A9X2KXX8_9FLAO|nr:serine hydrolase domain-containing protein [Gramella oceanisediminis]MCP9200310.1 beta-lactamase family protein [Gramella oceanisediminis]
MRSVLLHLFIGLFVFSANSQEKLEEASPESVGISSERLGKISAMLEAQVENKNIPGAVALIARDGKIVLYEAFGDANIQGEDLEKDDIFRIASQTKAITATAVMILWEEGKLRLDDPVSKYIPEFKDPVILESFNEKDSSYTTKPAASPITIRSLLTHTSGIGYGMIDGDDRFKKIYAKSGITDLFTTEAVEIGENIKKLATLPLHHEPFEKWTYSEGYDVLGYLVEVISGRNFDEFLKLKLFDPLNMNDTYFYLPQEKEDRLVQIMKKADNKWVEFGGEEGYDPEYPIKGAKAFFSGGAGLSSTALDYAKFLQMYLNKGSYNGNQILSPNTVKMIMANHSGDLFNGPESYYGLAFGVLTEIGEDKGGLGSEGTFEWGGYFNTQYFADPETKIIGILLKQTRGPLDDQSAWKFRQMTFSSIID